jgi:hypothetical protein
MAAANVGAILKTLEALLPLIVTTLAPGPVMLRSLAIISSPVISIIVSSSAA